MYTSDVETLIDDEKITRTLSASCFRSNFNRNPYFIWFGILDQSNIIYEYPSRPLSKIQSDICDFLSNQGSAFCFPDPTIISKHPFVFKIIIDLKNYYGICSHVKKSGIIQNYVIVTAYPFFSKYMIALREIDKLVDTDRNDWLQNLYQTPTIEFDKTSCIDDVYRDKILKWGLIDVLSKIPIDSRIFKLILTAMILERQIILISPDLYLLSKAVLCFPLLISPFTYQCHEIPIVPSSLLDLLATPTPYIAGVSRFPSNHSELSTSVIIIDLERCVELSTPSFLPNLPNLDQLIINTTPFVRLNSERRHLYLAVVGSLFEDFFSELFNIEMVRKYRICRRDRNEKISIFLTECFLESIRSDHISFYREFFQTQIFTQAINYILREIDTQT